MATVRRKRTAKAKMSTTVTQEATASLITMKLPKRPPFEMAQGFTLTPWTLWMPKREYSSIEQRLHHEIEAFVRWSSESPEEKEVRSHVIAQITKILHERYPRCLVQVFGSSCTGLGVPVADIDMVISNLPAESKQAKAKILYQLSPIFLRRFVTNEAQILKWAKVPLITFTTTHMLGAFNVDIGINHIDGVSGVELIKQFVDEMPALRPLVMVLKSFLKPRGIGSAATGGLGSYGLTCMAISFLQLNPAKLETRFLQNPFEAESLGILLKEFFKYYSRDFPYTTSYISITEATLKPKGQAPWIQQNLPDRFVIECPVTCKHDVTKPLTRTNEVRMAFAEALSFIESKASLDRPQTLGPEIIAVDKTTIMHRDHLMDLVNEGQIGTSRRRDNPLPGPSKPARATGPPAGAPTGPEAGISTEPPARSPTNNDQSTQQRSRYQPESKALRMGFGMKGYNEPTVEGNTVSTDGQQWTGSRKPKQFQQRPELVPRSRPERSRSPRPFVVRRENRDDSGSHGRRDFTADGALGRNRYGDRVKQGSASRGQLET